MNVKISCVTTNVVLVCDRPYTIGSRYVLQGYFEILVSFSFFIKAILEILVSLSFFFKATLEF